MVIIKTEGDQFWIETLQIARLNINTVSNDTDILPLTKTGQYLGICYAIDGNLGFADAHFQQVQFQDGGGAGFLTIGQNISSISVKRSNGSGNNLTWGVHITVFLRRPA